MGIRLELFVYLAGAVFRRGERLTLAALMVCLGGWRWDASAGHAPGATQRDHRHRPADRRHRPPPPRHRRHTSPGTRHQHTSLTHVIGNTTAAAHATRAVFRHRHMPARNFLLRSCGVSFHETSKIQSYFLLQAWKQAYQRIKRECGRQGV